MFGRDGDRSPRRHGLSLEIKRTTPCTAKSCQIRRRKVIREGLGQAAVVRRPRRASIASSPTRSSSKDTGIYKADIGSSGLIADIGNGPSKPGRDGRRDQRDDRRRHDGSDRGGEGLITHRGRARRHSFHLSQQAHEAIARRATPRWSAADRPGRGQSRTRNPARRRHFTFAPCEAVKPAAQTSRVTAKGKRSCPQACPNDQGGADRLKLTGTGTRRTAAIDCCLAVADEHDVQATIYRQR